MWTDVQADTNSLLVDFSHLLKRLNILSVLNLNTVPRFSSFNLPNNLCTILMISSSNPCAYFNSTAFRFMRKKTGSLGVSHSTNQK